MSDQRLTWGEVSERWPTVGEELDELLPEPSNENALSMAFWADPVRWGELTDMGTVLVPVEGTST
jgi:hypothetical protein